VQQSRSIKAARAKHFNVIGDSQFRSDFATSDKTAGFEADEKTIFDLKIWISWLNLEFAIQTGRKAPSRDRLE
jgi:hypothetical protein